GMVHIELFNYIAGSQKQKGQRPEMEASEELIFTPQGFLRAFAAMQNLVGQLEQAGVIKKNDNDEATPVNAEIVDDKSASTISPNWNNK
ncbi:MAG: hypothetical protein KAR20_29585, partial [Candidatus Heimdallarchaeota archaeon]|nr:hypothetical protein [Candidatus Heimdallarchaeota archaeon]